MCVTAPSSFCLSNLLTVQDSIVGSRISPVTNYMCGLMFTALLCLGDAHVVGHL